MTRDDIIKMAREAGAMFDHMTWVERDLAPVFERFAELVAAAEREKVARWMTERGYATGHGNTIEELLQELDWQIREQEREACTKVAEFVCSNGSCRFTLTQTGVGIGARKL
jgi:beta-glucosidase/6-phospho-beta-glucosidase/beta-galactosidase